MLGFCQPIYIVNNKHINLLARSNLLIRPIQHVFSISEMERVDAIYDGFVTIGSRVWLSHLIPFIVCGDGHGGLVISIRFFVCHAANI